MIDGRLISIGTIYVRALDPSGWVQTFSEIAKRVRCQLFEPELAPKASPEINAILGGARGLAVAGPATCGFAPAHPCVYQNVSPFQDVLGFKNRKENGDQLSLALHCASNLEAISVTIGDFAAARVKLEP